MEDFKNEVYRYVNLIDQKHNEFEVLVERVKDNVYFRRGWAALRDFFGIRFGTWIFLLYFGHGQFEIILKDHFYIFIEPSIFNPPMKFKIDKTKTLLNLLMII